MHNWGKEGVDWKGINDAAAYIGRGLRKWRVPVRDYKEKYGTVRVYTGFGWWSIHDITHPGHAFVRYKKDGLLWKINYSPITMKIFGLLNKVVVPVHIYLYKVYYRKAVKKWPHLREEILIAADWTEYLTEFGFHRVHTDERTYTIHFDWHPDNWSARNPREEEDERDATAIAEEG